MNILQLFSKHFMKHKFARTHYGSIKVCNHVYLKHMCNKKKFLSLVIKHNFQNQDTKAIKNTKFRRRKKVSRY